MAIPAAVDADGRLMAVLTMTDAYTPTRRRVLQTIGVGSVIGLAGCIGGNDCDRTVSKEYVGETPLAVGDTAVFEITVCNDGEDTCESGPVTVTDELPSELSYLDASGTGWSCSESGGVVTCEHSQSNGLGAGDCLPPITLEAEFTGGEGDAVTNCARLADADARREDCATVAIDTTVTTDCDLSITKFYEGEALTAGETASFTITVCNESEERCPEPVSVVDALPSGLSYAGAGGSGWSATESGGTVTATHGNANGLAPGDCLPTLTVEVEVGSMEETGDALTNCASIRGTDANGENNRSCVTLPVEPPADGCDLQLTKRHAGDTVSADSSTSFTIDVCNVSKVACDDPVTVVDDLPDGLTFVTATGSGWSYSESGGTVTAEHDNAGGLDPGECLPTLTVEVEVGSIDETGDQFTNCASLEGTDANARNDRDCVTIGVTDGGDTGGCEGLNIEKTTGGQFRYGQQGTYEIEVCNFVESTCNATIEVTDTLTPGLTFVSASGTGWSATESGGTVTATHANSGGLSAGQCLPMLTITVDVDAASDFPGGSDGITNCAQVLADGTQIDEDCISHVITNQ